MYHVYIAFEIKVKVTYMNIKCYVLLFFMTHKDLKEVETASCKRYWPND